MAVPGIIKGIGLIPGVKELGKAIFGGAKSGLAEGISGRISDFLSPNRYTGVGATYAGNEGHLAGIRQSMAGSEELNNELQTQITSREQRARDDNFDKQLKIDEQRHQQDLELERLRLSGAAYLQSQQPTYRSPHVGARPEELISDPTAYGHLQQGEWPAVDLIGKGGKFLLGPYWDAISNAIGQSPIGDIAGAQLDALRHIGAHGLK